MSAPAPVTVSGGSAGLAADCADIVALAARFGATAHDTLAAVASLHGYLVHPALLTSAVLDPAGFAAFEGELLAALDGWQGLSWAGLGCGALDGELRLAASAYGTVDTIAGEVREVSSGLAHLVPALTDAAVVLAGTRDPMRAAQVALADDPRLADAVTDVLGIPTALSVIAHELPDGHGVARDTGIDRGRVAGRPPRSLTDLLADLAVRNGDVRHGEIDVRLLTMADGSRRAVVDITGTKSWDPLPTRDVTSLTTNGRALVGERTAYEGGVLAAMRAAGVRRDDPVMLVGHSEGGMVAVTTARDALASGEFHVTHVITAGSPVGRTVGRLPGTVQVLALENAKDVVPHLDGAANPDRPNVTTASSAHGDGTVVDDHDITDAYLPLAGDVEASRNRSIRDFLAGARPYFAATAVETHTYQIQRRY